MFGIGNLFAAVKRLTSSVNAMADIFDQCNQELAHRFKMEDEDTTPSLPNHAEKMETINVLPDPATIRNGKSRVKS